MDFLEIKSLTKRYGPARAVEDVSFAIPQGEIFGYLGPNGSGKTTTIRCILGLLKPSGGEVRVFGKRVRPGAATEHERIGYLPGDFRAWRGLTARRALKVLGALGGGARLLDRREALAERLSLNLDRPIGELSKGNRQKVGIVFAFQHEPELLVLDEPTSGLDPLVRQIVLELIREAAAAGGAVLLSSHDLSEVAAVCSRAGILREGRLVELDRVSRIVEQRERRLKVWFEEETLAPRVAPENLPGVRVVLQQPGMLELAYHGSSDPVVKWLAQYGVERIETPETSLEESFLQYYSAESPADKDGGLP